MAKQLTTASIATGQTINAGHVTQSSVAFTGGEAYDIIISGSLTTTGSILNNGNITTDGSVTVGTGQFVITDNVRAHPGDIINLVDSINVSGNITSSGNISASGDIIANSFTGNISPSNITQPFTNITASGNISASGDLIGNGLTIGGSTGPIEVFDNAFILKLASGSGGGSNATLRSSDKDLIINSGGGFDTVDIRNAGLIVTSITASGNISASGDIVGATFGNSSGDIIFTGNVSGSGTNSSYFGDEYNAHGGDANSGFTLLSLGSKPSIFANGASLEIGNATNSTQTGIRLVGEVTASSNISASGQIVGNSFKVQQEAAGATNTSLIISGSAFNGDNRDAQIIYPTHGLHFNSSDSNNHVLALAGNKVGVRVEPDTLSGNDAFTVSGSIKVIDGDISASGDFNARQITGSKLAVGNPIPAAAGYTGITSKFNGGAFFNITSETTKVFGIHDSPDGADILQIDTDPDQFLIDPINNGYKVGIGTATPPEKLTVQGNISASGNGIFKAGKPIITHTANLTASLANAGLYHIVGGTLTCSVSISSAPIGAEYEFFQTQSGNFLFETGSGITLISKNDSLRLAQLGSSAVLKKVGTSTFHLMGDLT